MVIYDPKDWISFILSFHKADTVKKLFPAIIAIGLYSALVVWLETEWIQVGKGDKLNNVSILQSMLGFVISMLLVFRTNTAYERWWEGRKLWGALVNSSRNLAIKLHPVLDASHEQERHFFAHMIPNYAFALKNHLRKKTIYDEFTEQQLLQGSLNDTHHVPNRIARMIYERINRLYNSGVVKNEQLLTLSVEVQQFTEICGGCERIKNTPIPFSYSSFIKKFIFFYIITLPWGYVYLTGYFIVPIVVFVFYVLGSLELIAEEIEDPFGTDANDLPTDDISQNIRSSVTEILGKY